MTSCRAFRACSRFFRFVSFSAARVSHSADSTVLPLPRLLWRRSDGGRDLGSAEESGVGGAATEVGTEQGPLLPPPPPRMETPWMGTPATHEGALISAIQQGKV